MIEKFSDQSSLKEIKSNYLEIVTYLKSIVQLVLKLFNGTDLTEKRAQLQAINDSIQKMEKQGLSIPEDLRNLKIKLSSRVTEKEKFETLAERISYDLKDIIVQIDPSLEKALKKPHRNTQSKKRFKTRVIDLINAELIPKDVPIIHRNKLDGEVYDGLINSKGQIVVNLEGKNKVFRTPTAAALEFSGRSTNGWEFWSIKINNEEIPLSELRNKIEK